MAIKANHHPLVRDLRKILDRHGLAGAVLMGITPDGETTAVSAGHDVKTCNALGPILDEPEIDLIFIEMIGALRAAK